jgi:hypothetical protein
MAAENIESTEKTGIKSRLLMLFVPFCSVCSVFSVRTAVEPNPNFALSTPGTRRKAKVIEAGAGTQLHSI